MHHTPTCQISWMTEGRLFLVPELQMFETDRQGELGHKPGRTIKHHEYPLANKQQTVIFQQVEKR